MLRRALGRRGNPGRTGALCGVAAKGAPKPGAEAGPAIAPRVTRQSLPVGYGLEIRDVLLGEHAVDVAAHDVASESDLIMHTSLGYEGDLHIGTST